MAHDVLMPQLGQAMVTGTVVGWHAAEGGEVKAGEPLLTIESDKSAYEIEAPITGTLRQFVLEGDEVEVGHVLGRIGDHAEVLLDPGIVTPSVSSASVAADDAGASRGAARKIEASPKARLLAVAENIDLGTLEPTRGDGLIVAQDIIDRLAALPIERAASKVGAGQAAAIKRLQTSWQQAPHFTQMIDVDASRLSNIVRETRNTATPITINDVVIWAAAKALGEMPDLNTHIEHGQLFREEDITVSIAVATERGLRTPMLSGLKNATIADVAGKTRTAIDAARTGTIKTGRASLTVTNLGRYGIRAGTPVLNLDEPIIIFIGSMGDQAVVVEGKVVVRRQLSLSIAFDHRVIDGLRAAEFSGAVRRLVEGVPASNGRSSSSESRTAGDKLLLRDRQVALVSTERLRCDLADKNHQWLIDEPAEIGGDDAGPDPVTATLGALLSCMTIAFKLAAKRRGVDLAKVCGGIEATPSGKIDHIRIALEVWTKAPEEKVHALIKPAKASCYVHAMLRTDLEVETTLTIHATGEGR